MPTDLETLLSPEEVARRLGLSPRTVKEYHRNGKIPGIRLSRRVVRFEWGAVLRALKGGGEKKKPA